MRFEWILDPAVLLMYDQLGRPGVWRWLVLFDYHDVRSCPSVPPVVRRSRLSRLWNVLDSANEMKLKRVRAVLVDQEKNVPVLAP